MANQYSDLEAHLKRVRWAWKRAAAAKGAAVVVMEALGMLAAFALLDHMYALPQIARLAILGFMACVILVLICIHVVRPLFRRISDEQIALYIEERDADADGALISATMFGKESAPSRKDIYGFIIGSIVESAVRRAGSIRLQQVLNLSQLRKYAIIAALLLLVFGASALRFRSVQSSASRLLLPWEAAEEEHSTLQPDTHISFDILLDPGPRVPRSGQIELRAKLNREPATAVELKYRTKGSPDFRSLKMTEIEELYAFSARLPDINDDMDLIVKCGEDESQPVHVAVYDPLIIRNYEVVITPPAYTKQPATLTLGNSADVTALIGSSVRVRAITNTPIKTGECTIEGGTPIPLKPFNDDDGQGALVEFSVQRDGGYKLTLANVYEPDIPASAEFRIKAVADEAPSVSLIEPGAEIAIHPSAEIDFRGRAADDVGLESVELVYSTSEAPEAKVRREMSLADHGPGEHETSLLLTPSEFPAPLQPGGTLFYHVEAKDLAGQVAISDIFMVKVRAYEVAGAYPENKTHYSHAPAMDLMQFIAAAWNLHTQKPTLEKAAYEQQCAALADKMVEPDGTLKRFKKPKLKHMTPEQKVKIELGEEWVRKAVRALRDHDAELAVSHMRHAVGVWSELDVQLTYSQDLQAMRVGDTPDNHSDGVQDALGFTRLDAPSYSNMAPQIEVTLPDYRRRIKPDEAKALLKETRTLQTNQERLIAELKMLAATAKDEDQKEDESEQEEKDGPQEQTAAAQSDPAENSNPELEDPLKSHKKHKSSSSFPKKGNSDRKKSAAANGQSSGQQQSEDKDDKEGKESEARSASNQLASGSERKKELMKKQDALARDAAELAKRTASLNSGENKDAKEIAEALRQSSQQMNSSLRQMQSGNMQQALARSEEANRQLKNAYDKLDRSQFDSLDRALEATDRRAMDISAQQRKIREGMTKILEEARARNAGSQGGGEAQPKLNTQDLAKLKGLTDLQLENQRLVDDLEKFADELEKWAATAQKPDAAEKIHRALKVLQRENLSGQMANAAVSMRAQETTDAAESLARAEKTLDSVSSFLSAASNSMAQTKEQKLKRAVRDAEDIAKRAEQLSMSPSIDKPENSNANAGAEKQKPTQDAKRDPGRANSDERRKAQAELYRDTVRWAKHIAQDRLADGAATNALGGALKSEEEFSQMFQETERSKLDRYLNAVRSTSVSLDEKLKDVLKQKRLSAAQREQTPPQYRAMVNSYYEALAKDKD